MIIIELKEYYLNNKINNMIGINNGNVGFWLSFWYNFGNIQGLKIDMQA